MVTIPDDMSFEAAATLPCAGLTAWRAVAVEAPVGPGDTVLVQGTGGVSIFALQFAKARGATIIATSSSDEKLERARALGADHLINYTRTPRWGEEVLRLTGRRGVDVVVEVGGEETLGQAIQCTRVGGRIVVIGVIGVLSGFSNAIALPALFSNNLHLIGISVGSRAQFEDMLAAMQRWKMQRWKMQRWKMQPLIDRSYGFAEVQDALREMRAARHFGKLCIRY